MLRFQVPQFIDIEDKLLGVLSLRQAVYLVGGGGLIIIVWRGLPRLVGILLVPAIGALAVGLAFYKYHNRPFIFIIQAWLKYIRSRKLYLWKQREKKAGSNTQSIEAPPQGDNKLTQGKLRDLSWGLDVLDQ